MAKQAVDIAFAIPNPDHQAPTLAVVTETLAQAGQLQQAEAVAARAETIARSLTDPDQQAQALAALARGGQDARATAVARSITDPSERAKVLVAIGEALAADGDMKQARHVAAAACAVGRWTTAPRLELSLDPAASGVLTNL